MNDTVADMRATPAVDAPVDVEVARSVDGCLARLRALAPTLATVRTDKFLPGPTGAGNPRRVFLETLAGASIRGSFAREGGRSLAHVLGQQLRLDAAAASASAEILHELWQHNRQGAWCVTPSAVPELVLSATAVGARALHPDSYLTETCELLTSDLPRVATIAIDYLITPGGARGAGRRRAFLRFLAPAGQGEVAALDAAGFALHARHQLLQPEGENLLELNLDRMRTWSAQLGITAEELAETFGTLTFLTSALHVTRIRLR
jgi:hypothetical protein